MTQTPDYQFLALPIAIGSGALFLLLSGMFLYSNRWETLRAAKLIEPYHIILLGLLVAAVGVAWQWRREPLVDPRVAALEAQIKPLQNQLEETKRQLADAQKAASVQQPIQNSPRRGPAVFGIDQGSNIRFEGVSVINAPPGVQFLESQKMENLNVKDIKMKHTNAPKKQ